MCGINGVFYFNNSQTVNENDVIKMRETLRHRGPDGAGIFISKNQKVGFGHRRLAIIDLSPAGAQPMANNEKTIWIVFNGEIYNFQELRETLKQKYTFHSRSDTEVIIHAYEEYGFDCVKQFNGMFAFALWDEQKQLLFAARDHLGIKPFYYAIQNGAFYFGSEIKAILAHPDFKKELNEEGLSYYLTFSSVPAPHTMFKDIKKLPAAHLLIIRDNGEIQEKEYWNPITNEKRKVKTEKEYIEQVHSLLKDSIKRQMVSDVPFGCFLSGGIDSSTPATLMSEVLGHPVETFSVGSHIERYNEFAYSRKIAQMLGVKNYEIAVNENNLREFLTTFAYYADDLNGDYICFPLFYLAQFTRQNGVIVVQIGEGADEIFAGYPNYLRAYQLYERWWKPMRGIPNIMKNALWNVATLLRAPRFDFTKEYIRRLAHNQEPFWGLAIAFSDYQKEKLLTDAFKKRIPLSLSYEIIKQRYAEIEQMNPQADFLQKMTYLEIKHRLPEFLLARADKMTMAHSLEGRVPFLDHRLVELAFSIPTALKFKNNQPKYMLKKAVENILPPEIVWRKKQGFSTPMNEWLKPGSPTFQEMSTIVFQSKIRERNILNEEYVKKVFAANRSYDNAHIFRLWNLIALSLWYDYWF